MMECMPRHACNAYCRPPEHCDLVFTSQAPVEAAQALVAHTYRNSLGLRVLRVEAAREAPDLAALPADTVLNLTPHRPRRDDNRWLVWWSAS